MSFQGIRSRDLVRFRASSGKVRCGRAQRGMTYPTHVVVKVVLGSKLYPAGVERPSVVVNESNYVSHVSCGRYL